jgi:DNA-binding MarR family transcriptional regulator
VSLRGRVEPDPADAESPWTSLRRVHFYIDDLVFWEIERLGIGLIERRVLDTLAFAEAQGARDGIPVAAICDLIPPRTNPQTVGSALERMRELGWVEILDSSMSRGRRWRLSARGREVRRACKDIVEMILQENYHKATDQQLEALLDFGQAAMEFMDTKLAPVVHRADPAASIGAPARRPNWAALRRTHFYINDLIFTEVEPIGVGANERRVLDALGFAAHHGARSGVTVKTICDLIAAPLRPQAASSVLQRMETWGWVAANNDERSGRRRGRRWHLSDGGRHIRGVYKEFAEVVMRDVYGRRAPDLGELLALAQTAERHRSVRLEPIVALAIEADG